MSWLNPRNFTAKEKAWIGIYFLVVAVLSTLPYLVFYSRTPVHQHYTWSSVFYYDDYFQYYAWARHVAAGDWLIRNYYTDNPAAQFALFNPYFLLLGWATRAFGNVYFAYHVLRIVAIGGFAWISYSFIALFLPEVRMRRLAQVLMLGGGVEYPYFRWNLHRIPTPLADPYTFKVLYRYGHLTVGLCLLLLVFGTYADLCRGFAPNDPREENREYSLAKPAGMLFLCSLLLGLINPYYMVLVGAVLMFHACWLVKQRRYFSAPLLMAVGAGMSIPFLHYRMQSITSNLGAIGFDDPIGPFDLLLFFAPFIPWLIVQGIVERRRSSAGSESQETSSPEAASLRPQVSGSSLLWIWLVVVIGLVLTPLAFRARMVYGVQIALAIQVSALIGRSRIRSFYHWPLYALLSLEVYYTFHWESVNFSQGIGSLDRSMLSAFEELNRRAGENDVVLTWVELGAYLPAYCKAKTYLGHSFQTDDFDKKMDNARGFFRFLTNAERKNYADQLPVKFVLLPPEERGKADADFDIPGWTRIYNQSGYEIYARPE